MNFKIHKKIFAILLSLSIAFTACDAWIDTDINTNPDAPSDVPLAMLLPSIQANMAYNLGGNDIVLPTNAWMQYINGYSRQMLIIGNYQFVPSDVNNVWNSNYYVTMMDCKVLIDKALAEKAYHFAGVGQICLAYNLAVSTDLFGDIPYSEAFQGSENLTPKVDSQESIYTEINSLLDQAISNLQNSGNTLKLSGDMIHGSNAAAWIKTAYALKARYALVLSKRKADAYSKALSYLANAYTSGSDNMAFTFGTSPSELHPITQFCEQRGDVVMGKYFIDLLMSNNDPRLSKFAAKNDAGTYAGSPAGSETYNGISGLGTYVNNSSAATKTYFMTYAELKFIEAEAKFSSNKTDALAAYIEGVRASLIQVLGSITGSTTWLANNIENETTSSLTLEKIMTQKYIANYAQMQAYNDWRRTGYPKGLEKPVSATKDLPLRFPYAQEEISYNANIAVLWQKTVFLNTPVWWDAD